MRLPQALVLVARSVVLLTYVVVKLRTYSSHLITQNQQLVLGLYHSMALHRGTLRLFHLLHLLHLLVALRLCPLPSGQLLLLVALTLLLALTVQPVPLCPKTL
jgi:hypothetical protein